MSTIAETKKDSPNPANVAMTDLAAKRRIPLGAPVRKLQVDPIPGYVLHWFRSEPSRIRQAQQAGYEFVSDSEVYINASGIGSEVEQGSNADMGTRVTQVSGSGSLILMKIREEWHQESRKILEQRNDEIAAALRGGDIGLRGAPGDTSNTYVDSARTKIPKLFQKKAR